MPDVAPLPSQVASVHTSDFWYARPNDELVLSPIRLTRWTQKRRIRIYCCSDQDTGFYFGEIQLASEPVDMMGFLVRAWLEKPWHLMKGMPSAVGFVRDCWHIPQVAQDTQLLNAISVKSTVIDSDEFHSACLDEYQKSLSDALLVSRNDAETDTVSCEVLGALANLSWSNLPRPEQSKTVVPLRRPFPEPALPIMDSLYTEAGAWRQRLYLHWPVISAGSSQSQHKLPSQ
ncbi:hypothetical protein A3709_19910 [Halioglobus sp. HI00S01]|nr:hypothetical protein A3709_19910 [Halioglobus sp. HI00S01]